MVTQKANPSEGNCKMRAKSAIEQRMPPDHAVPKTSSISKAG